MVVATTTTTIAVAVGIRATVVGVLATRSNSFTVPIANARTQVLRRPIALVHVETSNTNLTVVVTITTTIAAVNTTAVTVAANLVTRDSGTIAVIASVWIQVSRRKASVKATKEVVWPKVGLVTAGVTMGTTTVAVTGTTAIAAVKVATIFSLSIAKIVNAQTQQRRRMAAQAAANVVPRPILETNDVMTKITIADATGTMVIVAELLATISSTRIVRPANVWIRQKRNLQTP